MGPTISLVRSGAYSRESFGVSIIVAHGGTPSERLRHSGFLKSCERDLMRCPGRTLSVSCGLIRTDRGINITPRGAGMLAPRSMSPKGKFLAEYNKPPAQLRDKKLSPLNYVAFVFCAHTRSPIAMSCCAMMLPSALLGACIAYVVYSIIWSGNAPHSQPEE
jgi:hypothetical protein